VQPKKAELLQWKQTAQMKHNI